MTPETNTAANPWDSVESVETDMIKFENIGKVVVGVLIGRKMANTKYGESPIYRILTAGGEAAFFSTDLLDDKLQGQIGKIVRIEFTETKSSNKGSDAKIFDVKAMADTPENRTTVGLNVEAGW